MNQKNNNFAKAANNLALFEDFIKGLREDIKQKPTDNKYIALFTLEVVFLEYFLKGFLSYYHKKNDYHEKTLGKIIKCCECTLKTFDKNKVKNKWRKRLLDDKYITSFINACTEINKLRNKLFHNLFKDPNINLRNVIRNLKNKIETRRITYDSKQWKMHKQIFDGYKSLIGKNGSLPKKWTIEMVTKVCGNYLGMLV